MADTKRHGGGLSPLRRDPATLPVGKPGHHAPPPFSLSALSKNRVLRVGTITQEEEIRVSMKELFKDIANEYDGSVECPNDSILAEALAELRYHRLTETSSALLAPMTFRVVEQNPEGAIQLKSKYKIEYRVR